MSSRWLQNTSYIIAFFFGIFLGIAILAFQDFEGIQKLENYQPKIPSKLYDVHGELITEYFTQKRSLIPFERMPDHLVNAFIAMEDSRYYDHFGVDPQGIARAFFVNFMAGRIKEGGSTITQQLAKIVLTDRERSFVRKLKEAYIALLLEQKYSKKRILNLYLNQIYLGHGAYGVKAASEFYFRKPVDKINVAEAALLAALPSAPNYYSPFKNPHISQKRHKQVLVRMVENGFLTPDKAQEQFRNFWVNYHKTIASPSVTVWGSRTNKAPYFTEYVRRILEPKLGKERFYTGGLKIYSTLDLKKQRAARKVIAERLAIQRSRQSKDTPLRSEQISGEFSAEWQLLSNLFQLPIIQSKHSKTQMDWAKHFGRTVFDDVELLNFFAGSASVVNILQKFRNETKVLQAKNQVEGALISIDYHKGEIRAMVGGSGFHSGNQLNRTVQMRRQVGSSFKPFVYSTAMDKHDYTPATLVQDTPLLYLDNLGDFWTPQNYSGMYQGPIRLRRALEKSRNVISVKVAEKIGIEGIINNVAHMIGIYQQDQIDERFPKDLSIALGSASISPLEMARAFSVFARGGKAMVPYAIRRVEGPQGNVILSPKKEAQKRAKQIKKMGHYQILRPVTATLITSILKTAVARGTGAGARQHYRKTVAGKTGTTDDFHDAWFVGFNHSLTTAIWFGYDTYGRTLGPGQSGGHVAAPVFGKYYSLAQGHLPNKSFGHFAKVKRIKICAKSGKLPSPQCQHTMMEMFEPGTQPTQVCEVCAGGAFSTKAIEGVDEDLFNPDSASGSAGSRSDSGQGIEGDNIFQN